jgi:hypothetical protein
MKIFFHDRVFIRRGFLAIGIRWDDLTFKQEGLKLYNHGDQVGKITNFEIDINVSHG